MRRVQLQGGAREPHARRTLCTLSVRPRAPTKQMGPYHRSRKLGGGLCPPSEPSPQDAVRAAGRRGAGAPPSEASDPAIRAAGRRGAGAPPSEASDPTVRAAGRRGAGAPPSEASDPAIHRRIPMDERELRSMIEEVRMGRMSRRHFVQAMIGLGLTAPLAAQVLASAGVAQAQSKGMAY